MPDQPHEIKPENMTGEALYNLLISDQLTEQQIRNILENDIATNKLIPYCDDDPKHYCQLVENPCRIGYSQFYNFIYRRHQQYNQDSDGRPGSQATHDAVMLITKQTQSTQSQEKAAYENKSGKELYQLLISTDVTERQAKTILKQAAYTRKLRNYCDAEPGRYYQLVNKVYNNSALKDTKIHLSNFIKNCSHNVFNSYKTHTAKILILEKTKMRITF